MGALVLRDMHCATTLHPMRADYTSFSVSLRSTDLWMTLCVLKRQYTREYDGVLFTMTPLVNDSSCLNSRDSLSSSDGADQTSQLSGATVFWALLAIVFNAMAQDSPTAVCHLSFIDIQFSCIRVVLANSVSRQQCLN